MKSWLTRQSSDGRDSIARNCFAAMSPVNLVFKGIVGSHTQIMASPESSLQKERTSPSVPLAESGSKPNDCREGRVGRMISNGVVFIVILFRLGGDCAMERRGLV